MAGQRAGKSFLIGVRSRNYVTHFPKMVGMIAANTYQQLNQSTMKEVRAVWKNIFGITEYHKTGNPNGVYVVGKQPPIHFTKYHEFDDYRGVISFRNGAVIFTASLKNYLAHEGKTLGWAELDETKDTEEIAIKQVILARLSQTGLYYNKQGQMVYSENPTPDLEPFNPCVINTSPAEGTVDWLEDMFDLKDRADEILKAVSNPQSYYYREDAEKAVIIWSTYWNAGNLPSNYIRKRKGQLTDGEFMKFILGYPFSKMGDEYFIEFNRLQHVKPVEFLPYLPSHLSYDFNLKPYMTLLGAQYEETETQIKFKFFDEFCYRPPKNTTEAVSLGYIDEYGNRTSDIFYYGDAMGTRGIEGFGNDVTRFDDARRILENFITADSDRTTRVNQGVNKRRNLINKILAGKFYLGHRQVVIEIDPKCEQLIRDLQYLKSGPNGKLKEKDANGVEKFGHTADAMEYLICWILSDYL